MRCRRGITHWEHVQLFCITRNCNLTSRTVCSTISPNYDVILTKFRPDSYPLCLLAFTPSHGTRTLEQAFTVDCFDDIVLLMPLLAPAAS